MYAAVAKSSKMNFFKAVVQSKVMQKKLPMNCKIVLNNNKTAYNPGNEIIGHVQVTFNEEFVYYGIKLVLEGIIHVKYRQGDKPYEKKESLLTESVYLVGELGKQKMKSKPETNSIYPFTIQIPSTDVPGTFQGPFGNVSYHMYVLFDYGDNKLVKKADKPITVNPQFDLDPSDISITEPIEFENALATAVKQVSHKEKRAEPALKFTCRLEQTGYISGENMEFELELENPKNKFNVKGVTIALVQKVTYHGGAALKKSNTVLASATIPAPDTDPLDFVPPSNENPWKGSLLIPRELIPSQHGVIEFEYFVKVTVPIKGIKDPLAGECLITMGTTRDGISADFEQEATSFYTSGHAGGKHDSDDE